MRTFHTPWSEENIVLKILSHVIHSFITIHTVLGLYYVINVT